MGIPLRQELPFVFGRGDVQPRSIHLQDTIADLIQQGHKMWRRMLPVTIPCHQQGHKFFPQLVAVQLHCRFFFLKNYIA